MCCQPVAARIGDDQRRLQRAKRRVRPPEDLPCFLELVGMRPVLGVVERDERAGRKRQGEIQRLRFGLRADQRHGDDLEAPVERFLRQGGQCFAVAFLADQLDFQLGARPSQRLQRRDQIRDDGRFPVQRDDDRINRPLAVGEAHQRGQRQRPVFRRREKPQHDGREEKQGHRTMQRQQRCGGRDGKSSGEPGDDAGGHETVPRARAVLGRKPRIFSCKPVAGVMTEFAADLPGERGAEPRRRRDRDVRRFPDSGAEKVGPDARPVGCRREKRSNAAVVQPAPGGLS